LIIRLLLAIYLDLLKKNGHGTRMQDILKVWR